MELIRQKQYRRAFDEVELRPSGDIVIIFSFYSANVRFWDISKSWGLPPQSISMLFHSLVGCRPATSDFGCPIVFLSFPHLIFTPFVASLLSNFVCLFSTCYCIVLQWLMVSWSLAAWSEGVFLILIFWVGSPGRQLAYGLMISGRILNKELW